MDDIDRAFQKLYGKLPTFLERDQFLRAYRGIRAYITMEDTERIAERVASNFWKEVSEREKKAKLGKGQ